MQACGGLTPKAREYCEVQRDAGKKKTHKAQSSIFLWLQVLGLKVTALSQGITWRHNQL